jgi:uracil phosphoribosyltransferase
MVTELDHALVRHWLSELRAAETPPPRFRELLRSLSAALFMEASRDLPLQPRRVRTPLAEMEGHALAAPPVLVPILRAGLGMAEPILELLPEATVCHLGIYRDHATLQPVFYYTPQIRSVAGRPVFVLDPMLGTGGSADAALQVVRQWGGTDVRLLCILASRPGLQRVRERHPEAAVFVAAVDEQLNDVGYIVPGLGDAGDRQFG